MEKREKIVWRVIYVLSPRECVSVNKRFDNQVHVAKRMNGKREKSWEDKARIGCTREKNTTWKNIYRVYKKNVYLRAFDSLWVYEYLVLHCSKQTSVIRSWVESEPAICLVFVPLLNHNPVCDFQRMNVVRNRNETHTYNFNTILICYFLRHTHFRLIVYYVFVRMMLCIQKDFSTASKCASIL